MDNRRLTDAHHVSISGPDGWCFGLQFFFQLALFERTGYADWEIDIRHHGRHLTATIRRVLMQSRQGGVIERTYEGFEPITEHDLGDREYSWQSVLDYARALAKQLRPAPIVTP